VPHQSSRFGSVTVTQGSANGGSANGGSANGGSARLRNGRALARPGFTLGLFPAVPPGLGPPFDIRNRQS